ncbi:Conserved membrane protein of uncharacterised function [Mycobacteroides abscessus subsp. abscessus]|nr:Conserved membrane protein of uncharacterised function [Mycobacteroides abscessus subsp. abscessus]
MRKQLDDAIPETPLEQRRLLIDVITTAARADRTLEDQSSAFDALRNLVINAPAKLDTLTQQVVAVTARLPESERILGQLRTEFDAAALASIGDNVAEATERVRFADSRITHGRELAARALEGQQMSLVDAIRGAESALTQANALLDAIDNAANNIRHAIDSLAASIADTKSDIAQTLGDGAGRKGGRGTACPRARSSTRDRAPATGRGQPVHRPAPRCRGRQDTLESR